MQNLVETNAACNQGWNLKYQRTFLLSLTVGTLWLVHLTSSFTLDETVDCWFTNAGWRDVIGRTLAHPGQSTSYMLVVWLARQIVGTSEVWLRVVSLAAQFISCWLLYHVAKSMKGKEFAINSLVLFCAIDQIIFSSASARPYALALMFALASFYALVKWNETAEWRYRLLCVVSLALTVAMHTTFAGIVLIHFVYLYSVDSKTRLVTIRSLCLAIIGSAFLLVPDVSRFYQLIEYQSVSSWAEKITVADLFRVWFPQTATAAFVIGLAVALIAEGRGFRLRWSASVPLTAFLLIWAFAPAAILFGCAYAHTGSMFTERYLLYTTPALALLGSLVLESIPSEPNRRLALTFYVLFAFIGNALRPSGAEGWREAVATLNAHVSREPGEIFAYTGLIESQDSEWIKSAKHQEYLLGPFSCYPLASSPHLLPSSLDGANAAKLFSDYISRVTAGTKKAYLISRLVFIHTPEAVVMSDQHLSDHFARHGFHRTCQTRFGNVTVDCYAAE